MLGGGHSNKAAPVIVYSGLKVSTSQFDVPKQIFYGRRRLSTNATDYVNFQRKSAGKKSGSKKGGQKLYSYSASVETALGEGPIDQVKRVFAAGQTNTATTLAALGATLFLGTSSQTAWSYMVSWDAAHPSAPKHALAYRNTAYLGIPNLALGYAPSIPDNHYECDRANGFAYTHTTNGWIDPVTHAQDNDAIDCLPSDCLDDLLTNSRYGMGFTAGDFTANLAFYATYCRAQGIFFSPLLTTQEKATSIIDRWAKLSNTCIFWNGTKVDFCPLGDSAITANGATYTPNTTIQAALSVANDDFLTAGGNNPPVTVTRKDPADCYNRTRLTFTDRTLGYISNPVEYKDQTLVDQFGLRDDSSVQADEICDPPVAQIVVQLIGRREAYIRNTFAWKSPFKWVLLLPGDLVTLTEPNIGLNGTGARITAVSEDADGNLDFEAEEYPGIIGNYGSLGVGTGAPGAFPDLFATPDSVNTVAVVEPDSSFTGGTAQLLITASGLNNWGGCDVNVLFPGAATYALIGRISSPAIQGTLTGNLADHAGLDTSNTLSVDTTECGSAAPQVTTNDADSFRSLALIAAQPTVIAGPISVIPANGELIAWGDTTSTGTLTANLTHLQRGLYGTAHSAHSTGDQFSGLDAAGILGSGGSLLVYDLPPQYIGQTINLKFQSVNQFGNSEQDLSLCTEYQYTPTGLGYGTGAAGVPSMPTGLAATAGSTSALLTWAANPSADNVTAYLVYRANGTGASFGSASLIATVNALTYTDNGLGIATGYTYFLKAQNAVGLSAATSGVNLTTTGLSDTDDLPFLQRDMGGL